MSEKHLKLLDFILPKLSKIYDNSISLAKLTHEYKKETGIKFNYNEEKYFLDSYDCKYFEYIDGTNDHIKITPETKDIIDNNESLSEYLNQEIKQIQSEQIENHDLKKLQFDNLKLQNENLVLQNKQMKRYILYSAISFVSGAILTNIKDILKLLDII